MFKIKILMKVIEIKKIIEKTLDNNKAYNIISIDLKKNLFLR